MGRTDGISAIGRIRDTHTPSSGRLCWLQEGGSLVIAEGSFGVPASRCTSHRTFYALTLCIGCRFLNLFPASLEIPQGKDFFFSYCVPQPGHYHKECVKETQVPHTVLLVFSGSQRYRKWRTKATKSTPEAHVVSSYTDCGIMHTICS